MLTQKTYAKRSDLRLYEPSSTAEENEGKPQGGDSSSRSVNNLRNRRMDGGVPRLDGHYSGELFVGYAGAYAPASRTRQERRAEMKRYYVSMMERDGQCDTLKARTMRTATREFCLTVMTEGAVKDLTKHLRRLARKLDERFPDEPRMIVLRGAIGISCHEEGATERRQDVFFLTLDPVTAEYSNVTGTDIEKAFRKIMNKQIDRLL